MVDTPKDDRGTRGDVMDLSASQSLALVKAFVQISDPETRDLVLRLVQKLTPNSPRR